MCGRYTLIKLSDFTDMFPWIRMPDDDAEVSPMSSPPPIPQMTSATGAAGAPIAESAPTPAGAPSAAAILSTAVLSTTPRYNIAPTQPIAVVTNDGRDRVDFFRWGLVPPWARELSIGSRMINARVESLAEKSAFKHALRRRRCLIPASGFYEWPRIGGGGVGGVVKSKQAMYIHMKTHEPFAFAGLWEVWRDEHGNELPTCTIITGPPNDLVRPMHDRMPVILQPHNYRRWLDPRERSPDELMPLLSPFPAEQMEAYPVSTRVNSPANESAECIAPQSAAAEPATPQRATGRTQTKKTKVTPDDSPQLFG